MQAWEKLRKEVQDKELCCYCGTCQGVCPTGKVICEKEKVVFNGNQCIECNRCIDCCPGKDSDLHEAWINKHRKIYKGYALSDFNNIGSSGGVISAIVEYMLDQQLVEGVVGIAPDEKDVTRFEPIIINSKDDIKKTVGSKYQLIPTNIIIHELLKREGKYLYIGLPCQIQGLVKAMNKIPMLEKRIYMTISLFCGFNMKLEGTEYLISKSKIKKKAINSLEYRSKRESQTGFQIKSIEGEEFFVPKHSYTLLNMFFSPSRCWKCADYEGVLSDISCGDAWEMSGEYGWNRIICHNERASSLIEAMKLQRLIYVEDSSYEEIKNSQRLIYNFKTRDIVVRSKLLKPFPSYHVEFEKISKTEYIKALTFAMCLKICSLKISKAFLNIIPFTWISKLSRDIRNGNLDISEIIRYVVAGGFVVMFSAFSFWVLMSLGIVYRVANLISILLTKITAYMLNKFFVFCSKEKGARKTLIEMVKYVISRGVTGIIEYFGLIFLVDILIADKMMAKCVMIIICTILNYTLGKRFVFTD